MRAPVLGLGLWCLLESHCQEHIQEVCGLRMPLFLGVPAPPHHHDLFYSGRQSSMRQRKSGIRRDSNLQDTARDLAW